MAIRISALTLLCLFSGLLLGPTAAQAQNRFFPNETHGVTVQAGALVAKDVTSYAGMATVTLNGRFDLGVAYSTPHDKTGSGRRYLWKEVTPYLEFSVLRPSETRTLGLDVGVSYTSVNFNSAYANTRGGDGYTAGISAYWKIKDSENFTMMPRLGLSYMQAEAWVQLSPEYDRYEETTESLLVGIEFAVMFNEMFLVAPAVSFFDGTSTLALMAGVAFP